MQILREICYFASDLEYDLRYSKMFENIYVGISLNSCVDIVKSEYNCFCIDGNIMKTFIHDFIFDSNDLLIQIKQKNDIKQLEYFYNIWGKVKSLLNSQNIKNIETLFSNENIEYSYVDGELHTKFLIVCFGKKGGLKIKPV